MKFQNYLNEKMIVPDLTELRAIFNKIKSSLIGVPKAKSMLKTLNAAFSKYHIEFSLHNMPFVEDNDEIIEDLNATLIIPGFTIKVDIGKYTLMSLTYEDDHDKVVNAILSMIGHELIHKEQFLRRFTLPKDYPNGDDIVAYLSSPEEIMAYAYQTAQDLKDLKLPMSKIKTLLKTNPKEVERHNNMYGLYMLSFPKNSPVLKRFQTAIYKYLDKN